MEWVVIIEVLVAVVVAACLLFLVWMFVRRRWLSSRGGVFDCALRSHGHRPHWQLGMARYDGNRLLWYRVFSLDLGPRLMLDRRQTTWSGQRPPSHDEMTVLFTDHQVVLLDGITRSGEQGTFELAMTPASVTGLMSWLEASAPGVGMRGPGLD
ncbi:DUF2550 domain-containing protein [Propionibacteriaceae bacterium G1746]|uniref:DUF2550 domain-containing protein n=1 Tax=Aestuariimicrobium sp. G57 TaxID=3418485 RepID=UPI003C14D4C2